MYQDDKLRKLDTINKWVPTVTLIMQCIILGIILCKYLMR
jgi:hypothetical protein